jgi:hypothetical protein
MLSVNMSCLAVLIKAAVVILHRIQQAIAILQTYNIIIISATTRTNDSSSVPSGNMTETIPMITVLM